MIMVPRRSRIGLKMCHLELVRETNVPCQDITYVNDEAELVGVRYYIRLILEDSDEAAYWHTHEIFFHR